MKRTSTIVGLVVVSMVLVFGTWLYHMSWGPNAVSAASTSVLKVEAKQHSKNFTKQWIVASVSGDMHPQLKIFVKDPKVWNLIQVGKKYYASFDKHRDGRWTLGQISRLGDSNFIR